MTQGGYSPPSAQDRAVSAAAARSLAMLCEASIRALLFYMYSIIGMKEKQLLSNYREFERAL